MSKSNPNQTEQPTSEPKLTLRKETLRDLTVAQLRQAAGGGGYTRPTGICVDG